ncbi:MAG: aldo/keto reductase [candidate division NC10 bacterium]|nr:aldo/keto reductase [candidate division NC10 bacterium]
MPTPGFATAEGTAAYRARFAPALPLAHFRDFGGLALSSIGLGTYLGEPDAATDGLYREAVVRAVGLGCNVIDSAINYRFQRSERAVGEALRALFGQGVRREEVVVATKGGYIPFDGGYPPDPHAYFLETFVRPGVARPEDVVAGSHCMTPAYLKHQLGQSLANLGLECVDIYYLHNPEQQLDEVPRAEFLQRMRAAVAALEEEAAAGRLRAYGTATWNGYRVPPGASGHLTLQELVRLAQEVAGEGHHFRVIQLPMNLAMPEALTHETQALDGERVPTLVAAARLGTYVMASASLLQARLTRGMPPLLGEVLTGLTTDAQRALQFVRSAPGLGTALVGMKQEAHVLENLATARVPPAPPEQFDRLFTARA